MATVYYDFKLKSDKWSPYVGAGLGFAAIDISNPSVIAGGIKLTGNDLDDTVFAYQIMAGIGYNISKNITLSGGYKYFGAADATFTGDMTLALIAITYSLSCVITSNLKSNSQFKAPSVKNEGLFFSVFLQALQ